MKTKKKVSVIAMLTALLIGGGTGYTPSTRSHIRLFLRGSRLKNA